MSSKIIKLTEFIDEIQSPELRTRLLESISFKFLISELAENNLLPDVYFEISKAEAGFNGLEMLWKTPKDKSISIIIDFDDMTIDLSCLVDSNFCKKDFQLDSYRSIGFLVIELKELKL